MDTTFISITDLRYLKAEYGRVNKADALYESSTKINIQRRVQLSYYIYYISVFRDLLIRDSEVRTNSTFQGVCTVHFVLYGDEGVYESEQEYRTEIVTM
jgi:hypothetical protein